MQLGHGGQRGFCSSAMEASVAEALAAGMAQASAHAVRHDEAAAMAHLVEHEGAWRWRDDSSDSEVHGRPWRAPSVRRAV
jgi:hypothetical protein